MFPPMISQHGSENAASLLYEMFENATSKRPKPRNQNGPITSSHNLKKPPSQNRLEAPIQKTLKALIKNEAKPPNKDIEKRQMQPLESAKSKRCESTKLVIRKFVTVTVPTATQCRQNSLSGLPKKTTLIKHNLNTHNVTMLKKNCHLRN